MAAITLDDVVKQLKTNNDTNKRMADQFSAWFKAQQRAQLDALEEKREAKKTGPDGSKSKKGSDKKGGLPAGILNLGLPALVALVASVTGFDDALKAMRVGQVFKRFIDGTNKFIKSIRLLGTKLSNFVDRIKNFRLRLPDLPRISFVDVDGKPYDFTRLRNAFNAPLESMRLKLADLRLSIITKFTDIATEVGSVVDNIKTSLIASFDGVKTSVITKMSPIIDTVGTALDDIKLRFTNLFTNTGTRVGTAFDSTFGVVTEKVTSIGARVQDFFDRIPRLQFTMPEGATGIIDTIRNVFGNMGEGTGVLGFLGRIGTFLRPLLVPFEFLLKTVMRPVTQFFLSLIDFFVGFYEGFTMTDGTFMEKLTGGIEGGVLGVIKGFTDAIDMIFIDLPAWILEKLGFEGIADSLREFSLTAVVDPIWEAVKQFFRDIFNDPGGTMRGIAASAGNMAENLIKTILQMVLPKPGENWYSPGSLAAMAIPASVYTYAGLNKETGDVIRSAADTVVPATTSTTAGAVGEDPRRDQIAPIIVQDNSTKEGDVSTSSSTSVLVPGEAGYDPYLNTAGANYGGGG